MSSSSIEGLLKFAGEKIGGPLASAALEKGLNVIKGGSDTDKVLGEITKVFDEVKKVENLVDELAKNLDKGLQTIRSDILSKELTSIQSVYNTVRDCFRQAVQYSTGGLSEQDLKAKLAALQRTIDNNLETQLSTICDHLDQANRMLMQSSFVSGTAKVAYDGSKDFVSYYLKTTTLVSILSMFSFVQRSGF